MNCRNQSLLNFLSLSTNSDFGGCASVYPHKGQLLRPPEHPEALQILMKYPSFASYDPGKSIMPVKIKAANL